MAVVLVVYRVAVVTTRIMVAVGLAVASVASIVALVHVVEFILIGDCEEDCFGW